MGDALAPQRYRIKCDNLTLFGTVFGDRSFSVPGGSQEMTKNRRRFSAEVFSRNGAGEQQGQETIQSELYEQIGRLKMELEWLKKKAATFIWRQTQLD